MTTHYQIRPEPPPGELDCLTAAELAAAKFHEELSSDDPAPRYLIRGEWYCTNEDCPVREVQINGKWPEGDRPAMPTFNCPACRQRLKFHGYLKTIMLVPVQP